MRAPNVFVDAMASGDPPETAVRLRRAALDFADRYRAWLANGSRENLDASEIAERKLHEIAFAFAGAGVIGRAERTGQTVEQALEQLAAARVETEPHLADLDIPMCKRCSVVVVSHVGMLCINCGLGQ